MTLFDTGPPVDTPAVRLCAACGNQPTRTPRMDTCARCAAAGFVPARLDLDAAPEPVEDEDAAEWWRRKITLAPPPAPEPEPEPDDDEHQADDLELADAFRQMADADDTSRELHAERRHADALARLHDCDESRTLTAEQHAYADAHHISQNPTCRLSWWTAQGAAAYEDEHPDRCARRGCTFDHADADAIAALTPDSPRWDEWCRVHRTGPWWWLSMPRTPEHANDAPARDTWPTGGSLEWSAHIAAGRCAYGLDHGTPQCDRPGDFLPWWYSPHNPTELAEGTDRADRGTVGPCCLAHANYYATAWTARYPGETGHAAILPVAPSAAPAAPGALI